MPKQRITKELVVEAAFQLAREGGMEQVLVKNIAARLGCSVQPIYSYCQSMDGLRRDVFQRVRGFVREYLCRDGGSFQSTGQAYVRLAREEPELFKLFTLCPREGVACLDDLYRTEADPGMAEAIAKELELTPEAARRLHLNMIIYTIGLGAVFSAADPGIRADEIYTQQEQAYHAFLNQEKERNTP